MRLDTVIYFKIALNAVIGISIKLGMFSLVLPWLTTSGMARL